MNTMFSEADNDMLTGERESWPTNGPRMRYGWLPDGSNQDLYYSYNDPKKPGWFKGMEQIIRERNLWPEDAAWANCRYHSHCTLPPDLVALLNLQ
jgi:hypothetical protein